MILCSRIPPSRETLSDATKINTIVGDTEQL